MIADDPAGSVPDRPAPSASRRGRWAVLLAAAGLLLATAVGAYLVFFSSFIPHPSSIPGAPPDPRRDYTGALRNIDPAVGYVPDERCAECHADQSVPFAEHPMGRSLLPVARAVAPPPEDAAHGNPFEALGSQFRIVREGERVRHRRARLDPAGRPAAELEWEVHYVIGSGARGHSYLTNREGSLFQTPLSWYSQKGAWGLSPGFGQGLLTGRTVVPECLFCHANRANPVAGSMNRYAEPVFDGHAIGCQRCHGPGGRHVESGDRLDIVHPGRLEPALREAVCEQCHLEGEARVVRHGRGLYDFRPGLPLELFWSVFVRAPEAGEGQKAVGHVEQMYQSRCFQVGDGPKRMGCVSCHDPHERVPPARRVAHYRDRCQRCHEQRGCSLPLAERLRRTPEDSCIECHMPRYGASDIPHTASTDHRVPRDGKSAARGGAGPGGDGLPVVSFYRTRPGAEGEGERDLGVALVDRALQGKGAGSRGLWRALPALEAAVGRDPNDFPAAQARGHALALQGRQAEALAAFEALLARAPDWELALVGAASMAEALGRTEAALGYWRRAAAANPPVPEYRRRLALLLAKQQAWDEARPECEAWVRLDPMSAEARATRVACLLAAGDKDEARAEFARVEALAPENLPELRARFGKKLR